MIVVDVVVVGGGLAGLKTALLLARQNISVILLEARDRFGGRTSAVEYDSHSWDVGGQWVGASHHAVRKLAQEYNLQLYPQYDEGQHILVVNGKQVTYDGTISTLNPADAGELNDVVNMWNKEMLEVPLEAPHLAKKALEWDSITLEQWQRQNLRSEVSRMFLNFDLLAIFGVEPSQLSFLYFLYFLRSGEGYTTLSDIHGGAQQDKINGGTQQLSNCMARDLGNRVILRSPVNCIEQDQYGVSVHSATGAYRAKFVVVAVPPIIAGSLKYDPPMPAIRDQLTQRMPSGCVIKCLIFYEKCWWREKGFSGEVLSTDSPICLYYDATSMDLKTPALVGLVPGNAAIRWSSRPENELKQAIVNQLVNMYGEDARHPTNIIIKNWMEETFSRGCYTSVMPAGTLSYFGQALREPVGRIHWAGTETAIQWRGYMEGALLSGERAAKEVLARLRSDIGQSKL